VELVVSKQKEPKIRHLQSRICHACYGRQAFKVLQETPIRVTQHSGCEPLIPAKTFEHIEHQQSSTHVSHHHSLNPPNRLETAVAIRQPRCIAGNQHNQLWRQMCRYAR
jgi:hypothetical protein